MSSRETTEPYTATITIEEIDGKLNIRANIPDAGGKRIATALAVALLDGAKDIMDKVLNDNQPIRRAN